MSYTHLKRKQFREDTISQHRYLRILQSSLA